MGEYLCKYHSLCFPKQITISEKQKTLDSFRHGTLRAKINKLPPVQYYIAIYSIQSLDKEGVRLIVPTDEADFAFEIPKQPRHLYKWSTRKSNSKSRKRKTEMTWEAAEAEVIRLFPHAKVSSYKKLYYHFRFRPRALTKYLIL